MRPLLLILTLCFVTSMPAATSRPSLVLENTSARVVTDLGGGSIASFILKSDGLNPLSFDSWSLGPTPNLPPNADPRSMGHFLCLDRWGPATPAEEAHGMGPHGEASVVWWEIEQAPLNTQDGTIARLSAKLPLAGLVAEREIALVNDQSCFVVTETVTNTRPLGRIYNCVQHPSIAPPFLSPATLVDCNATRGFMQASPMPDPEKPEVRWPAALSPEGIEVDMRRLDPGAVPWVVSYLIEEPLGWVTAASPNQGLLLGYLWSSADYPWMSHWAHLENGRITARGLEFGTTGLHQPPDVLVAKGRIFNQPLFRFIDADESQTFRYACFLMKIPEDFGGTEGVSHENGVLTLSERGGKGRTFRLAVGALW